MIWFITVAFSKWNTRFFFRCVNLWSYSFVLCVFFSLRASILPWFLICTTWYIEKDNTSIFYRWCLSMTVNRRKNSSVFFMNEVNAHGDDTNQNISNYITDHTKCIFLQKEERHFVICFVDFVFFPVLILRSVCVWRRRKKIIFFRRISISKVEKYLIFIVTMTMHWPRYSTPPFINRDKVSFISLFSFAPHPLTSSLSLSLSKQDQMHCGEIT